MGDIAKQAQLMPAGVDEKLGMANQLVKSGLMPSSLNTPQKVFVALQMGHELGLQPMQAVNNISAVNGKPVLSADIQVAVARQHPEFGGMHVDDDGTTATVTVYRMGKAGKETFTARFSNDDAQRAGLTGKDVWKKYPQRMRKHRATAFALRDAFPDALAGFYTHDEIQHIDERNVTEPAQVGPAEPVHAETAQQADSEASNELSKDWKEAMHTLGIELSDAYNGGLITREQIHEAVAKAKTRGSAEVLDRYVEKMVDHLSELRKKAKAQEAEGTESTAAGDTEHDPQEEIF